MNNQASFKLLPHYFKFIGLIAAFMSLLTAFYCKLAQTGYILSVSSGMTQIIFACAMLILLMSKDKYEDERSGLLRYQVLAPAYIFLTGWIILEQFHRLRYNSTLDPGIFELCAPITGLIVLNLELLKNSKLADWTEKNKFLYSIIAVFGIYILVRISEWLWYT